MSELRALAIRLTDLTPVRPQLEQDRHPWGQTSFSSLYKLEIRSDLAPRSSGKENHLDVKPFVETLRVTNPVRQSRASSREASLAWGRVTVTAKRRQRDQTLCD